MGRPPNPVITPELLVGFLSLTLMEIVLGIDNVLFVGVAAARLPPEQRDATRRLGLFLALGLRVALLFSLSWLLALSAPLFSVLGREVTGRDLFLLAGGTFLVAKAAHEIHHAVETHHDDGDPTAARVGPSRGRILVEIILLDLVFSVDSIVTAVGMVNSLPSMIGATVIALLVMVAFSAKVGGFIENHPSVKILALAFLLLVGVLLVAEGLGRPIPKGYVYAAMAFSMLVQLLDMRREKRRVRKEAP